MSNACVFRVGRFTATVLAATWISQAQFAVAQNLGWSGAPNGLLPMLGLGSSNSPVPAVPDRPPMESTRRAPLARLIENPDQSEGAPPFALTDQTGTIQRYVEPVPGVDLESHIGQLVAVHHDTGSTLLASQLELPSQRLSPLRNGPDDERYALAGRAPSNSRRMSRADGMVEQAQYIDNDDATVQLVPDDMPMNGPISGGRPGVPGNMMPLEGAGPYGDSPVYADQMGPPGMEGPGFGPQYEPMQYGPGMMSPPDQMMGPCPSCGRYHDSIGSCPNSGCGPIPTESQPSGPRIAADVELSLLRPQVAESAIGKLSEQYQFSPRFILAARSVGNLDGRVRYWHYDRDSEVLGADDSVEFKFDVLDIEAVHRFSVNRSNIMLAAGLRLARIKLADLEDEKSKIDLIGLTLAADGLTPLGIFPGGHLGLVYGGRLSILGGDWGGDDNSDFVDREVRNDNVLVHELYGGVEIARRFRAMDIRARLVFEMQNWKSDALAQDADIESIGFFGPGLQLGAQF